MKTKIRVAVMGGTGVAGQEFLMGLHSHPWFDLVFVGASSRRAGLSLAECFISQSGGYGLLGQIPQKILQMPVIDLRYFDPTTVDLVFSALPSDVALEYEPQWAKHVPVLSTASAHRHEQDVPVLIPGVNLEHTLLLDIQRAQRQWKGFIVPLPNCTTLGLCMALKPIDELFGVEKVIMTSLQACSGAGRSPGVLGIDIMDNVIPYIPKEEEKVVVETKKILGRFEQAAKSIIPHALEISCTCTRVPVVDGHTEVVNISTTQPIDFDLLTEQFNRFGREFLSLNLPSAPLQLILVQKDPYRPQPRLDRETGGGLTTVIGRLRKDNVLGSNGMKLVLLSHNTKMGASLGAIFIAEYLVKTHWIQSAF